MGLDMDLEKRIYIGNHYGHRKVEGQIDIIIDDKDLNLNLEKLASITYRVMYWRKANAIHNWFVNNVQNGKDDCGEYYLDVEKLQELVDRCKEALAALEAASPITIKGETSLVYDTSVVADILPPQEGFFFGGTKVDQWYINGLEETVATLEAELRNDTSGGGYYYNSSW